jgi:hypothetical protein
MTEFMVFYGSKHGRYLTIYGAATVVEAAERADAIRKPHSRPASYYVVRTDSEQGPTNDGVVVTV